MKIETQLLTDSDYQVMLKITIDGREVFSVYEGEPEDNSLYRNFNDCLKIPVLLKIAYEAGKAGQEFELVSKEGKWE